MPEIGQTVAHFRIVEKIGVGGMGEVYLADDTTLDRKVALKFLPEAFTSDPEWMARFEREAKLLASLNHPNIAGIYGLEQADGNRFLVLEYVEGETLQARLSKGALPLEDALALCRQIAEGLEAAHEKGVIHRDLKPANVMITAEEKVKILDFGLAKALSDETQGIDSSQSPTLTEAMTRPGVILGTAAYMSPEQAKGKSVDKRADIWAFGCILYECLTGKKAFEGETVTETLAAILRGEPDWNRLPPNIHPRIRFMLERCLEKHSKDRYGVISDARVDIQKVLSDPSGVFAQPSIIAKPRKKIRVGLPWAAATLVFVGIIAALAGWILKPAPPPEPRYPYYSEILLSEDQEFSGSYYGKRLAISSDGTMIVYVANEQLYLKKSNELTARPIQGSDEDPTHPFFSPDGEWIGYLSSPDNQYKKILISGGSPVKLCDFENLYQPTWITEDMIVFGGRGRITLFSPTKGITEEILKGEEDEEFLWPQILPGGKAVLYTQSAGEGFQFVVQSLDAEEPEFQLPGGPAQYLPTGHIVYGAENTLMAIRFNPDTLEKIGGQVPLIEDVFRVSPDQTTQVAISDSGTLAYIPGGMGYTAMGTLVWVDLEGNEELIDDTPRAYRDSRISPDGTRVAFRIAADGNEDIWIYDLERKTNPRPLTRHEARDFSPIWTNDGKQIIFASDREGRVSIFSKAANFTGEAEQIVQMDNVDIWPWFLSDDDKILFFCHWNSSGGDNIGVYSMDGDHTPELLLEEEYHESMPQISPDGQWLAYQTDESGQCEVYINEYPDMDGGIEQVSTDGGQYPQWSPLDGKELFYVIPSFELMVVSVETGPELILGKPKRLFDLKPYRSFDIDPEGKRFLMVKGVDATEDDSLQDYPHKIVVINDWFEELKDKVPVD